MAFGNLHDDPYCIALAAQMTERLAANPYDAEIVPGSIAQWHVLVTQPSHEKIAAGHLIARGFGVYLPEIERVRVVRGARRRYTTPMFPGYLFVFVWAIEKQWRRIEACTGVVRMLRNGDSPAVITDADIRDLQAVEFSEIAKQPRPPRRKGQSRRLQGLDAIRSEEIVHISAKSYWAEITRFDTATRISRLHRALGLAY
jgi:transcription antitermination factor NusG